MRILEILFSIFLGYLFNYNIGIITYFILKGIFSNNYKISLFMLLNLFVYLLTGLKYLIFIKLYLISIIGIFFHDKIIDFIYDEDNIIQQKYFNCHTKFKNTYKILIDLYSLVNILISIPFYIIYDNIILLITNFEYLQKKILNNNLIIKLNENYIMFNKSLDYKTNNFYSLLEDDNQNNILNNIDNYNDEDLDNLLNNMLNPKNFMDIANDMRESLGKNKLLELEDKMKDLGPFMKMFEIPFNNFKDEPETKQDN